MVNGWLKFLWRINYSNTSAFYRNTFEQNPALFMLIIIGTQAVFHRRHCCKTITPGFSQEFMMFSSRTPSLKAIERLESSKHAIKRHHPRHAGLTPILLNLCLANVSIRYRVKYSARLLSPAKQLYSSLCGIPRPQVSVRSANQSHL